MCVVVHLLMQSASSLAHSPCHTTWYTNGPSNWRNWWWSRVNARVKIWGYHTSQQIYRWLDTQLWYKIWQHNNCLPHTHTHTHTHTPLSELVDGAHTWMAALHMQKRKENEQHTQREKEDKQMRVFAIVHVQLESRSVYVESPLLGLCNHCRCCSYFFSK